MNGKISISETSETLTHPSDRKFFIPTCKWLMGSWRSSKEHYSLCLEVTYHYPSERAIKIHTKKRHFFLLPIWIFAHWKLGDTKLESHICQRQNTPLPHYWGPWVPGDDFQDLMQNCIWTRQKGTRLFVFQLAGSMTTLEIPKSFFLSKQETCNKLK